jgi:hypothetical protein
MGESQKHQVAMSKYFFIFLVFFSAVCFGQNAMPYLLIETNDSLFWINKKTVKSSNGKLTCHILNIRPRERFGNGNTMDPLLVIRAIVRENDSSFGIQQISAASLKKYRPGSLFDYFKGKSASLEADRRLLTTTLQPERQVESKWHDVRIIYGSNGLFFLLKAQTTVAIYNTEFFEQFTEWQSAPTLLNIHSKLMKPLLVPVNNGDSIAGGVLLNGYPALNISQGKNFLIKIEQDKYFFLCIPYKCTNCYFDKPEIVIYKQDIGIVGFSATLTGSGDSFIANDAFLENPRPQWQGGSTNFYFWFTPENK